MRVEGQIRDDSYKLRVTHTMCPLGSLGNCKTVTAMKHACVKYVSSIMLKRFT